MKNKFFRAFACLIAIMALMTGITPVSAEESTQTVGEARGFMDGIVDYKLQNVGVSSVQKWIDGAIAQNAGINSEWYVIALSQSGKYDFSAYETALLKYLSENEVYSASSRQKYALALIAVGSTDQYIYETLNDSIGQQGIMSWIFGLHLLNNGYSSNQYTILSVKEKLLSLQLADGGWAVMGSSGDVDVTAMAIQSLAPHYNDDSSVKAAVDKALTLLSERQLESGDYSSYGIANPESTVQVLVALSSLGIDCKTDSRFIKNGNTLFDGVENYLLSDGAFSHEKGGKFSENATAQVFYSMVSYLRMMDGKTSIFVFDTTQEIATEGVTWEKVTTDDVTASVSDQKNDINVDEIEHNSGSSYKLWATLAIIIVAGVCLVLYVRKNRNIKNYIVIAVIAVVAVFFVWVTNFQTPDSYYESATDVKENVIGTVTLTIRCDTIVGKDGNEYIPDDGIILELTQCEIEEGDTVYDVLMEATANEKIHIETNGSAGSTYVEGINYIYEFDFGELSGWMYFVNGTETSVGCGDYQLSDGDKIEWLYTCQLGKDIQP